MTQNGNGNGEQIEDFDAIVAAQFGRIKINGKVYTILPVNAVTQRLARELQKQIAAGTEMTAAEFSAKLAPRCLDPEPTPEEAEAMPTVALERVMERASKGLTAMERVVADSEGKKEPAPEAAQTPTPS